MNATAMNIMRCMGLAGILCMLNACDHPASISEQNIATVTVTEGSLRGEVSNGVQAFLGVAYAAAPVGELRWRPTAPAIPWEGVRDARTFGASCPQNLQPNGRPPWTHEYLVHGDISEDCLFLNIWAPADNAGTARPVLVWFHGGAFVEGSASVPIYNGAELAQHGIIVVGVNYRLDALGFLAHPELSLEGNGHSGNYAVYDMIAALRWISDNISAFGGDPAQVTISGQSAGAAAVHLLIAAPEAKGLFARAIAQSGSGMGLPKLSLADAERLGTLFAENAGVASLAELRTLSVEDLLKTPMDVGDRLGLRFTPIVDGALIPRDLDDLPAGNYHDTPILTGLTADESSGMMPDYGHDTPEVLSERLQTLFDTHADAFARLYPLTDTSSAGQVSRDVLRDRGIAATWLWARERKRSGGQQPIWLYLFSHPEPGPDAERYGAFHSAELSYVFGTFAASPERPFTQEDHQLSRMMSAYWVNFINTGNPNGNDENGAELPQWPAFEPETPQLMRLQPNPLAQPVLSDDKQALFLRYVESGGQVGLF